MKKVACFFTCGYTEMDAMLEFLRRVRPDLAYDQYCPNRRPRSRRPEMMRQTAMIDKNLSGLTGQQLLEYVYDQLTKERDVIAEYDAVLIEDDLDEKFSCETTLGDSTSRVRFRTQEFYNHCKVVRCKVRQILRKMELPVILLYASPEIETWFLADWDNTFGNVFGPDGNSVLNGKENKHFNDVFRPRVRKNVLSPYTGRKIEDYGYFQGVYRKLSEELIGELERCKDDLRQERSPLSQSVGENIQLKYSKRLEGDAMLRNLNPDTVYSNCPQYFQTAVDELRKL